MKSITDQTPEEVQAKMKSFMEKFAKKTQDNQLVADVILFTAMKKVLTADVMKTITLDDLTKISTELRNMLMDAQKGE